MYAAYVFPSSQSGMPTYVVPAAAQPPAAPDFAPRVVGQPLAFHVNDFVASMPSYLVPASSQHPPAPDFAPTVEQPLVSNGVAERGSGLLPDGFSLVSGGHKPEEPCSDSQNQTKPRRRRRGRKGLPTVLTEVVSLAPCGRSIEKTLPPRSIGESDDQETAIEAVRSEDTVCSDASTIAPFGGFGNPRELVENADKCNEVIALMDSGSSRDRHQMGGQVADWLVEVAHSVALSPHGCRVIQKVLGAGGGLPLEKLVASLAAHTKELYESPNGNHVLARICEVMPGSALCPIISQLMDPGPNKDRGPKLVARHRFGCRILERLIEHCPEPAIRELLDEVMDDSVALSRHPFGNFVIQHIIEHGSTKQKDKVMKQLIPVMSALAMHRTASHVVQRALDYSEEAQKQAVVEALVRAPAGPSLLDVSCNRYGAFVLEQIASVHSPLVLELQNYIKEHLDAISVSNHGRRVAEAFGIGVETQEAGDDIGTAMAPNVYAVEPRAA